MLYTLVYRCFTLCSDWSNFHGELVTLKEIFQRNGYPMSFIDKCVKKFLDRLHIIKPTSATVENKALRLVLPYLGPIFLQVFRQVTHNKTHFSNSGKQGFALGITLFGADFFYKSEPKQML